MSHGRVLPSNSIVFLCDIQEKWMKLFSNPELLAYNSNLIIKSAHKLGVPIVVTEHYKKAFGPTTVMLDSLKIEGLKVKYFEKQLFSMLTEEVQKYLQENPFITNVILFGLETHVYVVADAVFSRRHYDREIALNRFPHEGITVTTAESIILEMVQAADNFVFRGENKDGILYLLRDTPPKINLAD